MEFSVRTPPKTAVRVPNSHNRLDRGGGKLPQWQRTFPAAYGLGAGTRSNGQIGLGYSSLAEAEAEAVKLKRTGYKILRIKPITLPKPNS
jgi:hypothetical protein